ncbi:MAG TPA: hypothetical protein EYH20_01025 [Leucothrix sp.]|nr:hypothetical protein [Leucothrix sp.]
MFGAYGGARLATRMTFVSQAGIDAGIADQLDLKSLIAQTNLELDKKVELIFKILHFFLRYYFCLVHKRHHETR